MTFRTYMIAIAIIACAPQFNCSVRYPQGGNGGATTDVDTAAGASSDNTPAAAGAARKDWTAVCIAAETKNPANRNMATQEGITIKSLAAGICSQSAVVDCYSKGHCK